MSLLLMLNDTLLHIYLLACSQPGDDSHRTMTPEEEIYTLGVVKTFKCEEGYFFAQEEHQGNTTVEIRCEVGRWNVNRYPECKRKLFITL